MQATTLGDFESCEKVFYVPGPDLQGEKAEAKVTGGSPDGAGAETTIAEDGEDTDEEEDAGGEDEGLQEETLTSNDASHPGKKVGWKRRPQDRTKVRTMDPGLMERLRAEGAIDHALETLYGGYAVGDEIIYVEHRGKGVVVRERVTSERGPYGIWNEIAALHGPYLIPHFFYDGYSAVWANETHKVPVKPQTTATGHQYSHSTPSYTPAPSFGGGGWYGGGWYGGGYRPTTTATDVVSLLNPASDAPLVVNGGKLTGKWKLDLKQPVEVDFSSATEPVDIEHGSLDIVSGDGLTLNLSGLWDGVSSGVFDLVDLGPEAGMTVDGSAVVDGRDLLPSLGNVVVRYKDEEGQDATLALTDDEQERDYSLLVQDGTLSLVVRGAEESAPLAVAPPRPKTRKSAGAALPKTGAALSAAPATGLVLSGAGEEPGQGDITWTEESGEDVTFTGNGNVTLGGNVTAGTLAISSPDNYNFTLGDYSINATDFIKTGSGSLNIDSATGALNVETIDISGGSVTTNAAINASIAITVTGDAENPVSFTTTGAVSTPSITVDGASMSVNQDIAGLQSLTLANGATMNNAGNSAITFQPGTTLRVEGQSHSTLTGDWTINASKSFVLDFSAEYTSSINIASGTLTITGTRNAANVNNALILNLGAK